MKRSAAVQLSIFDRLPPTQVSPVVEVPLPAYVRPRDAAAHHGAIRTPAPGFERALVCIFRGLAEYTEAYRKGFDGSNVGDDCYCWPALEQIANALFGLLSAEHGRIDPGAFSTAINALLESEGSPAGTKAAAEFLGAAEPAQATTPRAAPTQQLGMRRLTDRQRELLANIRVEDNFAVYTPQEQIPDWPELKSTMVALGGKWRTKSKSRPGGFAFEDDVDAAELVRLALATGEVLDPKTADFFPTPKALAAVLVDRAEIQPGMRTLEPSAGRGAIAIEARDGGASVWTIEALDVNATHLASLGFPGTCREFLSVSPREIGTFDRVVMNPPFGKRQDIHHVRHAFSFLNPGGVLVAIMSSSVKFRDDKLATDFREFVTANDGDIWDNPPNSFAESGTGVNTVMVRIRKAAHDG